MTAHFFQTFSDSIFLLFLGGIPLIGFIKKVKVYEVFVEGAKEGFTIAIQIIPYLVAIIVAVGMFRAAHGFELLGKLLARPLAALHFPPDLLPLAFIRPFSGAGAKGVFTEIVQHFGANSVMAHTAGIMLGSTETTLYVLAIYFGAVSIQKTRYALGVGLIGDAVSLISAVIIAHWFF